jgi:hypothetical protein
MQYHQQQKRPDIFIITKSITMAQITALTTDRNKFPMKVTIIFADTGNFTIFLSSQLSSSYNLKVQNCN